MVAHDFLGDLVGEICLKYLARQTGELGSDKLASVRPHPCSNIINDVSAHKYAVPPIFIVEVQERRRDVANSSVLSVLRSFEFFHRGLAGSSRSAPVGELLHVVRLLWLRRRSSRRRPRAVLLLEILQRHRFVMLERLQLVRAVALLGH